jgi:predicted DCC family thiol-disulfide oxidoreductase YuxK
MNHGETANYEIEVFYDGGCPLCLREMQWLRRRDRRGQIRFTDIAAADFEPNAVGKTRDELMALLHARLADGTWLVGVEVFRRLYRLVGFAPLVAVTRLPVVARLLDWSYAVFARNRRWLTGRCRGGACAVPPVSSPERGG